MPRARLTRSDHSNPCAQTGPLPVTHFAVGPAPAKGFSRLPGHVLDAVAKATVDDGRGKDSDSGGRAQNKRLTLTVVLRRHDQEGFDRYLADVYDPQSSNFRHFLTQAQITDRYGPLREDYRHLLAYLNGRGFHLVQRSKNRMTMTVSGTRAAAEKAFALHVVDFKLGESTFYANDSDPALPDELAAKVLSVDGLSSLGTPMPVDAVVYRCATIYPPGEAKAQCIEVGQQKVSIFMVSLFCIIDTLEFIALGAVTGPAGVFAAGAAAYYLDKFQCPDVGNIGNQWNDVLYATSYDQTAPILQALRRGNLPAASSPSTPAIANGGGQTIGLMEFDAFHMSDVSDYATLLGIPALASNVSVVPVNGGVSSPGSGETEVLLDIDTVMLYAPGAKVVVYESPFNGQASSYSSVFNAMINGGVTIISNSWASCEDQVSEAGARGVDSVLQSAAASGISVFNGTGDAGSSCLDGSANTIAVPADSPSATAVGGTLLPNNFGPGYTYNGEAWWDGSNDIPVTGQGGFGVSKYFSQPTYQSGLSTSSMRSVPDVVAIADPLDGLVVCQADNGGCPSNTLNGGTSMSAPEWAALAALLNQAQGKNVGAFNPVIYPLANTDAFHNAASMSSDFAHVGLGSPNLNVMNRLLKGSTLGAADATLSRITPLAQPGAAVVTPVSVNGASSLTLSVPADGASQGGVLVTLFDANGNTVSGKTVTLTATGGSATIVPASGVTSVSNGAVAFTITDLSAETLTLTATDTSDGITFPTTSVTFGVPPAASAGITANPPSLPADGQTSATITVTLKDALGRPTPGKAITIADAGAHAVITGPTPGVTDANGQIQFSATDQVNETVVFTATDVTDSNLPVPGSGTVDYSGSTSTACNVGVTPVAGAGYTISSYITGLPAAATIFYGNANIGCPGGNNPAFTPAGTVLVSDFDTGNIYQLGFAGGAVSSTTLLNTLTPALGGLVYGKDGNVYATLGDEGAEIVQIDPTTATIVRVVASGLTCPAGLSVDPLSGDLFFDDQCTGGGTDDASIFRVINPSNSSSGAATSVVVYATLPTTPNGGMAFAPNGTLYAVSGYYNSTTAPVQQISGTNAASVTVSAVTGVTSDYAVAIGKTNPDGSAQSLIVEPAGTLSEIPLAAPNTPIVLATSSPGVGVTGPDGCLYSSRYDTVYRLANSTGTCAFAPTSPAPTLSITPATVSPAPSQGSAITLTAVLKNVTTVSGVPLYFRVSGANPQVSLVNTDTNGNAVLTYTATQAGTDSVYAVTTTGGTKISSNIVNVNWAAGKHGSFLSLNSSPQAGSVNAPVNVVATLTDISSSPVSKLTGASITFALGAASCTATTSSSGIATCALTPSTAGIGTLTATFAGTGTVAANSQSVGFTVSAAPTPAPTVTISSNPTSIAAGSAATLTWSSSNATACAASGAWSGTQATSGTASVTPTASGSYSYTLTCTGAGGSAAATAVLSATLVAVTVTAKSGGGAVSWYLLLFMALLLIVRHRTFVSSARAVSRRGPAAVGAAMLLMLGTVHSARGDSPVPGTDSYAQIDPLYVGVRVGGMPIRQNAGRLDAGLADRGFDTVTASSDTSGVAGTLFVGYEFMPHTAVELGYTFRDATAAHVNGTIPSTASLTPLLQDTASLIRDYGNIVSLSYAGRFEVLPRFSLEPRLGGFFWATKASAIGLDDRINATHEGGGVTAGLTAAYRVWRGLEVGVSVDHYHGFPSNIATLYAGTLEWRFGR
jgi:hypothetical protein